nr:transposase [Novosphingobium sp.]
MGRKRHIVTDTLGLMLFTTVHAASVQDRDARSISSRRSATASRSCAISADSGYAGEKLANALRGHGQWTLNCPSLRCRQGLRPAAAPLGCRTHLRAARQVPPYSPRTGKIHRKLHSMDHHHPYPPPHPTDRNPLSNPRTLGQLLSYYKYKHITSVGVQQCGSHCS